MDTNTFFLFIASLAFAGFNFYTNRIIGGTSYMRPVTFALGFVGILGALLLLVLSFMRALA